VDVVETIPKASDGDRAIHEIPQKVAL